MPRFQTYSWSIGTTSFRVKETNYLIERQLECLNELWTAYPEQSWIGNTEVQEAYYDLLAQKDIVPPVVNRKAKDAREKTSSLKDLGLITLDRKITEAGRSILGLIEDNDIGERNNIFGIENDSYIYLKQLLKLKAEAFEIRPLVSTVYLLDKLNYLTWEEFTYIAPLCQNAAETRAAVANIKQLRSGDTNIEAILKQRMKGMDNYQEALADFKAQTDVSEAGLMGVTMNRKSPKYDKPYFGLYEALLYASTQNVSKRHYEAIAQSLKKVSSKPAQRWKKLLFGSSLSRREQIQYFLTHWPASEFAEADTAKFREAFFWQLHLMKWQVNLEEYSDLNKRFLSLADILIMKDGVVDLQFFAKYYFKICIDALLTEAPLSSVFENDVPLEAISPALLIDPERVFAQLEAQTGRRLTASMARTYVEDERKAMLEELINERFPKEKLLTLLEKIEMRDDNFVQANVTDNANVPTIFEYLLGICWYHLSDRSFDLLNSFKLSLDANMLPKSHAGGGIGDIEIYYDQTEAYDEHWLLLEATLTNDSQQRRAEMEPVTRHLGDLAIDKSPITSYAVFASNYLDTNVVFNFRASKDTPYVSHGSTLDGLKIIPLDTSLLRHLLENDTSYSELYALFDGAYNSEVGIRDWFNNEIKQRIEAL